MEKFPVFVTASKLQRGVGVRIFLQSQQVAALFIEIAGPLGLDANGPSPNNLEVELFQVRNARARASASANAKCPSQEPMPGGQCQRQDASASARGSRVPTSPSQSRDASAQRLAPRCQCQDAKSQLPNARARAKSQRNVKPYSERHAPKAGLVSEPAKPLAVADKVCWKNW